MWTLLGEWGWSTPSPTPVQAGTPRGGCPGPCPGGFRRSPWKRLHSLPGQPMPVLRHTHTQKEFTDVQAFNCLLLLVLSLGVTERSLAASSLHISFRYLYKLITSSLNLLFFRLKILNSHHLHAFYWTLSCSSISISISFTEVPELDTVFQVWFHQCWVEKKYPWACQVLWITFFGLSTQGIAASIAYASERLQTAITCLEIRHCN